MDHSDADPKGLIRESYRIDGISDAECRSIFIDWALSLQPGVSSQNALRRLLHDYGPGAADHPMTALLTAALVAPAEPQRKGGRAARLARD